jgi:predicted secreted Zn-dependent protease
MRNFFATTKKSSFLAKRVRPSAKWLLISTLAAFLLVANSNNSFSALTAQKDSIKPKVSMQTTYYDIDGATVDELKAQMWELGPVDQSGRRNDAFTNWDVRWTYTCQSQDDTHSIGSVQVNVKVVFIFPRWVVSSDVDKGLVNKWKTYLQALQKHENGHKDIAIEAGTEIVRRFEELDSYASCEELGEAINSAGQRVLGEQRRKEIRYDKETDHGLTQGARLR